jgi:hypothetical protein
VAVVKNNLRLDEVEGSTPLLAAVPGTYWFVNAGPGRCASLTITDSSEVASNDFCPVAAKKFLDYGSRRYENDSSPWRFLEALDGHAGDTGGLPGFIGRHRPRAKLRRERSH